MFVITRFLTFEFTVNDCFFFGAIISATDPGKMFLILMSFLTILDIRMSVVTWCFTLKVVTSQKNGLN